MWSIRSSDPLALHTGLVELARSLDLSAARTGNTALAVQAAWQWLAYNDQWLLLVDGVDDPAVMVPLIPASGAGVVIVTSRVTNWPGWTTVRIKSMPIQAAAEFVLDASGRDDLAGARRLVRAVGAIPLAIQVAVAMCVRDQLSFDDFVDSHLMERTHE